MKFKHFILTILVGPILLISCNKQVQQAGMALETEKDTISYCLGINYAKSNIDNNFDTVSTAIIANAMDDVYNEDELKISEEDAAQILQQYYMKKRRKAVKENLRKGQEFLEQNKEKEGVKVTESGLQYKILKEGTGESPSEDSRVKVNYKGTFIDGDVFDSSYDRGEPATFEVNRVIPGWSEGIKMMKEGGKWKFFIPSDIAYGESGTRGIDPNSTLIFEVELLEVLPPQPEKQQNPMQMQMK
ncbi:MAG: FKBP-type peptidyl-prolyl cis-trans isomerase [Bacteroidota bacterium]